MDVFTSDQELVAEFRLGNEKAFSLLYRQYVPMLIDYASTRLESLDEANDMIHDLFVQLWETREQLEIKHSFKAFLFFCLKRRILNHYRKNNNKQLYAEQLQVLAQSFSHSPETYLEVKELQNMVENTLLEMTAKVREIYLLSREEHLSNKEIAERLHISEQTVKNQLSTAITILRRRFRNIGIVSLVLVDFYIALFHTLY